VIDYQRLVRDWHAAKGVPIAEVPTNPTGELAELRASLILEEAGEASDALLDGEGLPEIAKELADVLYVVFGTAVSLGIDLGPVFEEVHRSNMSKDPANKRADGKILKGASYVPPNIGPIIDRQTP
jgi:predicted HAD superfamily Cof-like phosphohydrolase